MNAMSRRLLAPILVALAGLLVGAAAPAGAAPVVDGEFDLTANPQRIALGPDGNMWVTLVSGNELARITPAGAVTEFDVDTLQGARGIAAGPNGRMWVTISGKLGHFDPADPVGSAATIAVAEVGQSDIAAGPDGNLWTPNVNNLVRVTPAGVATPFPILNNASRIVASDDALWVADFGGGEIVHVTTAGVPTRYAVGGTPQGVAVGSGGQVGYTDPGTNTVGRIAGGQILPTPVAPGLDPFGIAFGPDGAYWFAQPFGNDLGRLSADGAYTRLGGFSAEAGPRFVAAGPGNTLWVTLEGLNGNDARKVARVSGVVAPTPPPPPPPPPPAAAELTGLKLVPARFRVAAFRTPVAARGEAAARKRGKRRARAGSSIRFRIGRAATVRLKIERRIVGRRSGRRCVAAKRPPRRAAKRCRRWAARGTLVRRDLAAGAHRFRFSGRIGRRALKPGRHRVTAVAVADGLRSTPRRARFTILRRR